MEFSEWCIGNLLSDEVDLEYDELRSGELGGDELEADKFGVCHRQNSEHIEPNSCSICTFSLSTFTRFIKVHIYNKLTILPVIVLGGWGGDDFKCDELGNGDFGMNKEVMS